MQSWKRNIFVTAIEERRRLEVVDWETNHVTPPHTFEELVNSYPKLTSEEKAEILAELLRRNPDYSTMSRVRVEAEEV